MNGQQCYIEGNGQCNKIRGKAVDTHGVTNDNMATPTTIEMRGVETIMSSPGKRGRINHGNKTKLTQIFQNLTSNALKFRNKGTTPKVEINYIDLPDFHQFSIKDNGIGIEDEFHEQIFVIFKKLHNYLDYQGTGIGLTLVKSIVNQHGGEIWLESKVGKGTTFYFTLLK